MTDRVAGAAQKLSDLCREAVEKYGHDWPKIQIYVIKGVDSLPTKEQNIFGGVYLGLRGINRRLPAANRFIETEESPAQLELEIRNE